jgi:NodT family efflux transporter outer membrane factor (OMF) lipoprotein
MKEVNAALRERQRLGESSEIEVAQQRNLLAQAEASLPPILLSRDRAFNRVAILVGRAPGQLTLTGGSLAALTVPEVSAGLPADLLLRRPDIRKAEANLIAANANIGVARAKVLPSLSLTGERGWASQLFDTLSSPGSIYYTLAANLAATIFDNGKNDADIAYSRARHAELAEAYRQVVLTGLRDVEDALAAIRHQGDLEVAQREVVNAAQHAFALGSEAFRLGMVDYINLLETQRTRFQAEDAQVLARSGRLAASVALFKALGGGTDPAEAPIDPPRAIEEAGAGVEGDPAAAAAPQSTAAGGPTS